MNSYVGTDIIEIARIREALERWGGHFLERIYTAEELRLYGDKEPSLAARFAGKEAIMKLLGAGGMGWREVEILASANGQPYVLLHGKARNKAVKLGIKHIAISLSHSRHYAVATALSVK